MSDEESKIILYTTDDGKAQIVPRRPQEVLQCIGAEIESKQNAPQELWAALRGFLIADAESVPIGLVHDVVEFCLAVFDSLLAVFAIHGHFRIGVWNDPRWNPRRCIICRWHCCAQC